MLRFALATLAIMSFSYLLIYLFVSHLSISILQLSFTYSLSLLSKFTISHYYIYLHHFFFMYHRLVQLLNLLICTIFH